MDDDAGDESPVRCECGVTGPAPWSGHDVPWSLASFVAGVVVIAFAVLAAIAGRNPWVAPMIVTILLVAIVVVAIALRRHGHRRMCWATRSVWQGVASIGLPLRIVAGLPF